jgi:hypothetical protein
MRCVYATGSFKSPHDAAVRRRCQHGIAVFMRNSSSRRIDTMKPKLVVVGNGMVSRRALRTLLAALADDRPWMARLGCRPWMDLCDET